MGFQRHCTSNKTSGVSAGASAKKVILTSLLTHRWNGFLKNSEVLIEVYFRASFFSPKRRWQTSLDTLDNRQKRLPLPTAFRLPSASLRDYPNNRREASRCRPPTHLQVPFGDGDAPATGLFG